MWMPTPWCWVLAEDAHVHGAAQVPGAVAAVSGSASTHDRREVDDQVHGV